MKILLEIGAVLLFVGGLIVTSAFTEYGKNAGNYMWEATVKCFGSFGKCFGCFGNRDVSMQTPTEGWFIPTAYFNEAISARSMESVWAYLMNDAVTTIGVFGIGGIGKTTIMTHIHNRLLKEKPSKFDKVIWVTLSKSSDVRQIQNEIAKELGHDLSEEEDGRRRKSELYKMLSQWKRYVLILDDLWVAFSSLAEVGISETTPSNGCKLVFTTRSSELCRRMNCSTVEVELLTEDKALNLFMSVVENQTVVLAPEVRVIATEVAKECKRLPLAVKIIGGSLRGENDIRVWRNALNELTSLTNKEIRDDEVDLFERLKLSYSRLQDVKIQHCFLYCALYPKDHDIPKQELIGYWIAEELARGTNSTTREAMFDHGHSILNKLVNDCLLETLRNECVRMHALIRKMALKITTSPPRFMVKAGEGLKTVPDEDWVADLERISLMWNEIKVLPSEPPIFRQLTTLLLRGNRGLVDIPDSFFGRTPCLKVLDLSETGIKGLPNSISNLENLHALLLQFCGNLVCFPSLGRLTALEELNLFGTGIQDVQGIEGLVSLRDLNLCRTKINPQTFPPSRLCGLSQLQLLRIDESKVRVSAEVLLSLGQLEVLRAEFNNVQELTSYAASEQCRRLKNYILFVGINYTVDGSHIMGKDVFITNSELFGGGADPLVLPSSLEFLDIDKCHDLISLSDLLTLRDAKDLITCSLFDCNKIESIFSSSSPLSFLDDSLIPLKKLNKLRLLYLPRFKVLFDGVVLPNGISFNLKQLDIYECSSMKSIFPAASLLQNFPNLESLIVSNCKHVDDIIGGEAGTSNQDDSSNIITLPNLQELRLRELPKLKSIYRGKLVCTSLQNIWVTGCPGLRRLPLSLHVVGEQAVAPPALRRIVGEEEWWRSLEWDDLHTKDTLQPLFVRPSR